MLWVLRKPFTMSENPAPQQNQEPNQDILASLLSLLRSKESGKWSRLLRRIISFSKIWDDIFQTIVTIGIACLVVYILIYTHDHQLIDKSTFGVMFGTVIGYVLSWRFGK